MPKLKKAKVDEQAFAEIAEISTGAQVLARKATAEPSRMAAALAHALAAVIADTGEAPSGNMARYDMSEGLRELFLEDTLRTVREHYKIIRQEVLKRDGGKHDG